MVSNIYPAGVYTHLVSAKHNGVLSSPRLKVDSKRIWVRILGNGGRRGPRARLVLHNYPRQSGPIYRQNARPQEDRMRWHKWDTTYWLGETAHVEVATAGDLPVKADESGERSWFGIAELVVLDEGQEPPAEVGAPLFSVTDRSASSAGEVAELYVDALRSAIDAWETGSITDEQANFLGYFVERRLLPNTLAELPEVAPLVTAYRTLEEDVPTPTRAPGVLEADAFDQPFFVRGNHKKPTAPVPRRFLEALGGVPYETPLSGRLELAEDITAAANPLTARVAVNRIWHHVFGRGIVATTDNFGRLGEKPTHPQLLDYLASRFVDEGWSIKRMIRFLVKSQLYQTSSRGSERARRLDPGNLLLSHMPVRRLEAEAIRDALLAISGDLDSTMHGPSVVRTTAEESSRRRSVYVSVRRNSLDPFLEVFDAPAPFTTRGRRDITNVPAQSLTLLNSPFVLEKAKKWAASLIDNDALPADEASLSGSDARIKRMFTTAFSREPTQSELTEVTAYLQVLAKERGLERDAILASLELWHDVAQSLVNMKEFIYLK